MGPLKEREDERNKEKGKREKQKKVKKKKTKQPNKQKHRQMGIGAKRLGRILQQLIIFRCYVYNM